MKRSEIVVGGTYVRRYADGTTARRTVVGDADSRSPRQRDKDEVTVRVDAGRGAGETYSLTRSSLARWAEERTDTPETPPTGAAAAPDPRGTPTQES